MRSSRFGVDVGTDACRDAIAWGWEHADQVAAADNPAGLLYRVAQSKSRRYLRWRRPIDLPVEHVVPDHAHEPQLPAALARLSDAERVAVVLVHGYRYSYAEVAGVLGVPVATVRNHVHRGLDRLRQHRSTDMPIDLDTRLADYARSIDDAIDRAVTANSTSTRRSLRPVPTSRAKQ